LSDGSRIARRAFLRRALGGALALPLPGASRPEQAKRRVRRLLVFTKSAGFEHSHVARGPDGRSVVDRTVTALGTVHGFDVVCTKDGGLFSAPAPLGFDAFLFVTTGDLTERGTDGEPPMTAAGKRALLDAVAAGAGFVGVHSATDTFHSPERGPADPFIAMLGGEFLAHGRPQRAILRVAEPGFPGMPGAQRSIERTGEWYVFRNLAPDLRPLLVLETAGLEGAEYARAPYPVAWTRRHGKGRVACNALGHFDGEWSDDVFPVMLGGMIRWAFGDADGRPRRDARLFPLPEPTTPRWEPMP
jgi:hypothetical protein